MAQNFLELSPSQLRKNPWNTNKVTPDSERKIRASLERMGMFKPIIVRQVRDVDGYEILGGEHRWEQAIELGIKTIPVFNLGYIDDKRAKEIGLADNARYGSDDTFELADLLKSMGNIDDLQDFLPYGATDLDAIFSSTDIALDDLELNDPLDEDEESVEVEPIAKPTKTHTIMRFKVSLLDAERVTALIASTQKTHGLTTADELTNAGDALIQIIAPHFE